MKSSTIFICQLPPEQQGKIRTMVAEYLSKNNYDNVEEIIENVMSDKLTLLEEFFDINEFLI
jgi:hypothetical protein